VRRGPPAAVARLSVSVQFARRRVAALTARAPARTREGWNAWMSSSRTSPR
jgi:hypothetical protein